MKNKLLFIFMLCFIFIGVVSADTGMLSTFDASGVTAIVSELTDNNGKPQMKVKLNGLPDGGASSNWYALFVDSETASYGTIPTNENSCVASSLDRDDNVPNKWHGMGAGAAVDGTITGTTFAYAYKNYGYVYVLYYYSSGSNTLCKISSKAIKVDKPELKAINSRYSISFSGANLSVTKLFPYYEAGLFDLTTKIGVITNTDIITKLSNGDASAYNDILSFAKSDSNAAFSLKYKDNASSFGSIDTSKIEINKIYYIYTSFDNKTELRDIDGITIAQGKTGESSSYLELDATKIDYTLAGGSSHGAADPGDSNPPSNVPDNPGTGLTLSIGAMVLFLIGIIVLTMKSKRKFYRV
ncbi:MAG: hypothetical protein IKQ29_00855 [Bacilli bacterium]|nr:hypothetical protein [Bacilli bacterium]